MSPLHDSIGEAYLLSIVRLVFKAAKSWRETALYSINVEMIMRATFLTAPPALKFFANTPIEKRSG